MAQLYTETRIGVIYMTPPVVEVIRLTSIHMNKADMIARVHEELGGTKVQAETVVQTLIDSIVNALKEGKEVSIAGLGIFSTKMRKERTARNPRTGEPIKVAGMRVPKFRPAKALKDAVK
jgi:nucleoid DNA-binding protein